MKFLTLITVFIFISSCKGQSNQPAEVSKLKELSPTTVSYSSSQIKVSSKLIADFLKPRKPEDDLQVSKYIRTMFQDKKGSIWFGTNDDGVCRYDGINFIYYTIKEGLSGNTVRKIIQDETGILWFATNAGVSCFDGKTFSNFTVKDGLPDNDVWSILKDKKGNLWFGTMGGVCRFKARLNDKAGQGTSFTSFTMPQVPIKTKSRFTPNLVWSMYEDKAGNIWFGTDGAGVHKYDGASFTTFTDKDGLCGNNVLSIAEDKAGNIWFGTWGNGVSRYTPRLNDKAGVGTSFTNFSMDNGLCSNEIWTMMIDKKGNIWFGSLGNGISCYNASSVPYAQAGFSNFSENNGLTENHVQSILEDKNGQLWFGFSGGVFQFDGKRLINFTKPGC